MGAGMSLAKRRLMLNEPHLLTAQSDGILTLDTDMRAPLKALRVGFEPVQEGSGDPSPENVRPITGWNALNIRQMGKNRYNGIYKDRTTISSSTGEEVYAAGYAVSDFIDVSDLSTIALFMRFDHKGGYTRRVVGYDKDKQFAKLIFNVNTSGGKNEALTVSTEDVDYIKVSLIRDAYLSGTLVFGAPYTLVPISWTSEAGTVYGGYLEWLRDGTVKLTKTHEMITPTSIWGTAGYAIIRIGPKGYIVQNVGICNMLPIWVGTASSIPNGRFKVLNSDGYNRAQAIIKISGLSTVEDYNAWLQSLSDAGSPLQICYELATPVTYTLTPTEAMRTLRGENNIWSDANGGISATYWTH